jgi:hypothetical protein
LKNKDSSSAQDTRERPDYKEIVKENEMFETYYKHQKVCNESEYPEFITALKTDLPVTFRITSSKGE